VLPENLLYFATPASATADIGGGGAVPPAAAPAGGSTPPAAPAPVTGQPASGPAQGIEQLRTAYETLKKDFEPWQKLNVKPEQVTQYSTVYQKTFEEIASIGRQLGYPDDEIIEAIQENPVATLDVLRNELQAARAGQQQQRGADQSLQDVINQRLEEGLAPIQQWHNEQLTTQANQRFEQVAYQMAGELYKTEGLDIANVPADEIDMLMSATSEILKYDQDALKALKYEGKTAAIKEAFNEAKTMLDKYYLARSGRSNGGARGPAVGAAPGRAPNGQFVPGQRADGKGKASLDDLLNNPELINPKYAERA
jgi:hypothetical protein